MIFVIENRPGANSNIAAAGVARSRPDGYTLFVGANGVTNNMTLYANPGYDIEKVLHGNLAQSETLCTVEKFFAEPGTATLSTARAVTTPVEEAAGHGNTGGTTVVHLDPIEMGVHDGLSPG